MNAQYVEEVRIPVKRENAEQYVLLSLVSFAASVLLTRLFLELTGYPQIGNSELHIAHVLWGGLLLFIAALVPLIFANRWAYTLGALLSGVGVGLFIDEVGKFITQSNDYFYPAAAPIIYAFFLLTVFVYLQVRRPPTRDPRAELYRVLDSLTEVLDHDLDAQERAGIEERLNYIVEKAEDANVAQLAREIQDFINHKDLYLTEETPNFFQRILKQVRATAHVLLSQKRLKTLLIIGMGWVSILALIKMGTLLFITFSPSTAETWLTNLVNSGEVGSAREALWFLVRLGLEGAVGMLALAAVVLLLTGREGPGIAAGILSLLLSLTTVNLLVFYLDQFSAAFGTLYQFTLLLAAKTYRRWHLL